jgi:hypothetical protein
MLSFMKKFKKKSVFPFLISLQYCGSSSAAVLLCKDFARIFVVLNRRFFKIFCPFYASIYYDVKTCFPALRIMTNVWINYLFALTKNRDFYSVLFAQAETGILHESLCALK